MKNSLKLSLLALTIAASFTACDPPKGTDSSKAPIDTAKNAVDTAKGSDTTKAPADTVKKDSVK
ncbi:hypothetical protein HYN43_012510 [Mucilaginibacter celer]|uniref:Entericidin n=1 Tax=Mucilaginibacter celer TaxID=2305508 RepID=A0A494VXK6_9SPHI|nr:hypothetical protein HYN43_012510 [Mucilaginibacter celer]